MNVQSVNSVNQQTNFKARSVSRETVELIPRASEYLNDVFHTQSINSMLERKNSGFSLLLTEKSYDSILKMLEGHVVYPNKEEYATLNNKALSTQKRVRFNAVERYIRSLIKQSISNEMSFPELAKNMNETDKIARTEVELINEIENKKQAMQRLSATKERIQSELVG